MRAVQLDQYGPAENLKVVNIPIPEPKADEVLIRVEAAGIIFADTQLRRGDYLVLPPLPSIPGREVSGTIEKAGSEVHGLLPGLRAMAFIPAGGYAEYATAKAEDVLLIPDRVSHLQGLNYLINMRIAYLLYFFHGKTQSTEKILIHAAAGGVGTLITQIAKRRAKNFVIALSSSDEKLAHCKSNGADVCINYRKTDYVEEVLQITGGEGVDVSFNSVGDWTLKKDPQVIRPLGRWVIYGYSAGKDLIDPYEVIMPKSLTLSINSVYTVLKREAYRQATDFMIEWLRTEKLDSVGKTFRLEDVVEAHHWIEDQHSAGKVALII